MRSGESSGAEAATGGADRASLLEGGGSSPVVVCGWAGRLGLAVAVPLGLVALQGALIAGIYALVLGHLPPPRLRLDDVVTQPGVSVEVAARLEQDLPNLLARRLRGVAVTLSVRPLGDGAGPSERTGPPGKAPPLGAPGEAGGAEPLEALEALTGARGLVPFVLSQAPPPGLYRLEARARSGGGALSATAVLQSVPEEASLVLTALGAALWREGTAPGEAPAPLSGASEVLSDLAARHRVIYLMFRPGRGAEEIHRWLEAHGFPRGVVLGLAVGSAPVGRDSGDALASALGPWIRGRRIEWAFGATTQEALTFGRLGIRTVQLGAAAASSAAPADGVQAAVDWAEVRRIVSNAAGTAGKRRSP